MTPQQQLQNSPAGLLSKVFLSIPQAAIRQDIQALRVIAVLAVVINHLSPAKLPGGFVGVDVFFVISGFLITSHLLREHSASGHINLPKFYARRARRLLPAALVVTVASLLLTVLLLPLDRWADNAWQAFAAGAYFQNWALFAAEADYFAASDPPTMFQHYWSLSVEEQFYFVWPLLLLLILAIAAQFAAGSRAHIKVDNSAARHGLALWLTLFLGALSLGLAVWHLEINPSGAYFNTLGRAWEFLAGAAAAFAQPHILRWRKFLPESVQKIIVTAAQLLGYGLICFAAVVFNAHTPVPGLLMIIPVAGVLLVILAGSEIYFALLRVIVAFKPVQYLANISYSVYLWHWPLILAAPFFFDTALTATHKIFILVCTIILASASYYLVELPGRKKLFVAKKPRVTLICAALTIAFVGAASAAVTISANAKIAANLAAAEQILADKRGDNAVTCVGAEVINHPSECAVDLQAAPLFTDISEQQPWAGVDQQCQWIPNVLPDIDANLKCDFGAAAGRSDAAKVFLVGDSHAEHYLHTFTEIAKANEWNLTMFAVGGCYPVLQSPDTVSAEIAASKCALMTAQVSDYIAAEKPEHIFVSSASKSQEAFTAGQDTKTVSSQALATLSSWAKSGAKITVLRDVPYAGSVLGPECVQLHTADLSKCRAPKAEVVLSDMLADAAGAAQGVGVVAVNDLLCPSGVCSAIVGGLPVFYDNDHLARGFAKSLAPAVTARINTLWQQNYVLPTLSAEIIK